MTEVSLEDAEKQFRRLIEQVTNGEEVVITRDHQPVAKVIRCDHPLKERPLGTAKGQILYIADDFDAPLPEFEE